jgi:hypothetical protein
MGKQNVVPSPQTTLAAVRKEMARPRQAASVRNRNEIFMTDKFGEGTLLHNSQMNEDGLVTRVYQTELQTMYEVWVPARGNTWLSGYYTSDWAENNLELSVNLELKTDTKRLTRSGFCSAELPSQSPD